MPIAYFSVNGNREFLKQVKYNDFLQLVTFGELHLFPSHFISQKSTGNSIIWKTFFPVSIWDKTIYIFHKLSTRLSCTIGYRFLKQNCISFSKTVLQLSNMFYFFPFTKKKKNLVTIQLHCSYGILLAGICSIGFKSLFFK